MINLGIKVFLDSANIGEMCDATEVDGFTTNPTLMRRAGVVNYESWAKSVLSVVKPRPVSFEVLADDLDEMERQAYKIASWGANVYVKIPITNTKGETTEQVVHHLSFNGIHVNVTAVMTAAQIKFIAVCLNPNALSIISIFAGRIADTGQDPHNAIQYARRASPGEVLWASTREVYSVVQAREAGAHIITVTPDILRKLDFLGKNLDYFSLETVKQFYDDAQAAGYTL